LLVQRPAEVSLMAAMWELPQFAQQNGKGSPVLGKFRHSITDTDYEVSVFAIPQKQLLEVERRGHWFTSKQWQGLALTGLARKILRKLVD
jgi:adenine-specific DNA glycosylase